MDGEQVDQLKALEAEARESLSRDNLVLDLQAYWDAWRVGGWVPGFAPVNKNGSVRLPASRRLRPHQIQHVASSPLSPEFYESAHGVDALIVRDIRWRMGRDDASR